MKPNIVINAPYYSASHVIISTVCVRDTHASAVVVLVYCLM